MKKTFARIVLVLVGLTLFYIIFSFLANRIVRSGENAGLQNYYYYKASLIFSFLFGTLLNSQKIYRIAKKKAKPARQYQWLVLPVVIILFLIYKNIPFLGFPMDSLLQSSILDYMLAVLAGYAIVEVI